MLTIDSLFRESVDDGTQVDLVDALKRFGASLSVLQPTDDDVEMVEEGEEMEVNAEPVLEIPEDAELAMRQMYTYDLKEGGNKKKRQKKNLAQRRKELAEKPAPPKPRVVCKYFMDGVCSKGATCTFSHDVKPRRTGEEAKSQEVCRFHINGSCLKGQHCIFSHDLKRVPCKFHHLWNGCSSGEACRFSHDPISQEALAKLQ